MPTDEEMMAEYNGGVIRTIGLTKTYGKFNAVDHLDLAVRKGEFMGLLGPNGAGKSTTLKCIMGLSEPTSGIVRINGIDISDHRRAMEHVGCVIETPECYQNLSPAEIMTYVGRIHGLSRKEIAIRSRDVLEEIRLWSWRNKNIGSFSKGMKQRVAIAAALLPNPDIIILDEPTSGLDPRGMIEVRRTLTDLKNKDLTLLISTHMLKEVSEMCTSMTMINHGKKIVSGDVNTLIHNLSMSDKGVSIDIRLLNEPTTLFYQDLKAMAGVTDLERTGEKSLKFTFTGTDEQQADIIDLIYEHKLRPLAMNESGADLESLYMKLTDERTVNIK